MESLSERRLVENEVTFRAINVEIKKRMENLLAQTQTDDLELQFYCECSNENCRNRIELLGSEYSRIHKIPTHFVIVNGHEHREIEQIVENHAGYCVVEKFFLPPSSTDMKLNKT